MGHYLDIRLRADPELTSQQLLGGLYNRLHRVLVQLGRQDIGVSFPEHDDKKPSLGTCMRLHGPGASLQALLATSWLNGMLDHLKIGAIEPVPADARHRQVSRVQAKSSPSRLRRRAMRRRGWDAETAERQIPDSVTEYLHLPFVVLGSRSTGQMAFPLFIRHGPLLAAPVSGVFNSYGLSREATVPWF